ncbi:MAG: peptidoglycan bridge formation glycyltransferase FemA/FemB family protein [Anaerolineae bacterium]|nr:peptidoglycan bridge formation glycyltransferase FemA/FemB family protein [Anaerolineae bacterium]
MTEERTTILSNDIEPKRWNAFVAQWPDFVLMQSYEWGAFKEALGWKIVRLAVEQNGQMVAGAQMFIKPILWKLASIAYIPRGPLLDWEDETVVQVLLAALHSSARYYRAISLKIEPAIQYSPALEQQLHYYGFRCSPFNNQPQCSMLIDLTPEADTILANMHKTTRYNIHYSARKGVVVRQATAADMDAFYQLLKVTAKRSGFSIRSREYYHQEWSVLAEANYLNLFLALYQDKVIAARMPVAFGNKAATFHSGSLNTYNKLKANELLMWESLKWAKAHGCDTYDVWGIPEEVGAHLYANQPLPKEQIGGLWGVYQFKRGFGGDVVYYVGAYDFVYFPTLYWVMNVVINQLGSLEKLAQLGDRFNLKSG